MAFQTEGARQPFFSIGAGVALGELVAAIGSDQPVYGLTQAAWAPIEPPFTIEKIAAGLVQVLREAQPQGPYALGGWCVHGVLAFEVACHLADGGQDVNLLALFDAPARFADVLSFSLHDDFVYHFRRWRSVPWRESKQYFVNRSKGMILRLRKRSWSLRHNLGQRFHRRLPDALYEPTRLVAIAARDYRPRTFSGSIDLFAANDGFQQRQSDPYLGWQPHALGGVRLHQVPGDHSTMFQEPNLAPLGIQFQSCLATRSNWGG
ncbi:MAG: hypothetical protein GY953_33975 [bacterium]|nr:hypothetical protein [bacterium]